MKILKRTLPLLLIIIILLNSTASAEASSKIKINKTKATIYVGKSTTLKLTGTTDTVKWKTSNKKIATVSQKGKVKGIKKGKVTITATVNKKNYKCVVTVKKAKVVKITPTPKDNMNSLRDYINKNGFNAPNTGDKMIRYETNWGESRGESIRLLPNNIIKFSSSADLEVIPKGFYGNFNFTINTDDLKTISVKESRMLLDGKSYSFPDSEINMTDLVKKNDIKFNDDESINKEMNNVLDIVLERFNTFISEKTKLGLQDIGFTNYK